MGRRLLTAALCVAALLASPAVGTASAQSAPDEVSASIAALFNAYGQQYQQLQAQTSAFHETFFNMLQGVGGTAGQPLGGVCDTGVSLIQAAQLTIAPLHSCGAPPVNPQAFFDTTGSLLGQLSAIVGGEIAALQNLAQAAAGTAQQWQGIDPATLPGQAYGALLAQQSALNGGIASLLPFGAQMNTVIGHFAAQLTQVGSWFNLGLPSALRATDGAQAESPAPQTRAEAWARLVELHAELRAVLHGPGALPTHLRLPVRPRLPVTVVACETERCAIGVRTILAVGADRTRLPTQHVLLSSGKKAIVRLRLTAVQLAALHRHGGGRLAVTIVSDGQARTLHVRLVA
jgi:hypothetical protein